MLNVRRRHSMIVKLLADDPYQYYCKLFDDMIIRDLCSLRRHELNDRDRFSCRGCSKDTIINSPHNRLRRATTGLRP